MASQIGKGSRKVMPEPVMCNANIRNKALIQANQTTKSEAPLEDYSLFIIRTRKFPRKTEVGLRHH